MGLVSGGGKQVWAPQVDVMLRITSFFTALRYHFILLVGTIISFLLLPKKDAWQSKFERKMAFSSERSFLVPVPDSCLGFTADKLLRVLFSHLHHFLLPDWRRLGAVGHQQPG